jgi:hypothetical protein
LEGPLFGSPISSVNKSAAIILIFIYQHSPNKTSAAVAPHKSIKAMKQILSSFSLIIANMTIFKNLTADAARNASARSLCSLLHFLFPDGISQLPEMKFT